MIITITGHAGSGKSTVAQILSESLNLKRYYIGQIRRDMAREKGMTIEELNQVGENENWTDKLVDDYQQQLGLTEDNFIIEGRTSFYFIPNSFKIFLTVSPHEGARRIFTSLGTDGKRRNEGEPQSLEETGAEIARRWESDCRRYQKYYGLDINDFNQYDLVLDATTDSAQKIAEKIIEKLKLLPKP